MKSEVLRILANSGYEANELLPLTQILNHFRQSSCYSSQLEKLVWQRVDDIENTGLKNSMAEPGIEQVLEYLNNYAHLVALTNTNEESAGNILHQLGLTRWLRQIMGRAGARELKPAPGGMLELLALYSSLTAKDALAIGDAEIDMRAAKQAGLSFCAYNRSRIEQWPVGKDAPKLFLNKWDAEAARQILTLLYKVE